MLTRNRAGFLIALWWWIAMPFTEARFYQQELRRGAYPTDADSIGIPIAGFVFGWLLLSPLIGWIVWWIVRRGARGQFSWLTFDRSRQLWCILWTAALTCFAITELWATFEAIRGPYVLDAVTGYLGAAAALAARAGLCAPRPPGEGLG